MKARLLAGSSLGKQAFAPIPPAVMTSNVVAAPTGSPGDMLAKMREAIELLDQRALKPSAIVVDDGIPDGLTISWNDLCFITMSRAALEAIEAEAESSPYVRSDPKELGQPGIWGLLVHDLAKLAASENPKARTLASYYRAAINGYRVGLELRRELVEYVPTSYLDRP